MVLHPSPALNSGFVTGANLTIGRGLLHNKQRYLANAVYGHRTIQRPQPRTILITGVPSSGQVRWQSGLRYYIR